MNLIKIIVLSHASSASTDWDRVERTLGYDLAFLSMPHQYERILLASGITRDTGFPRDFSGNFYMTFAMTLSRLHSRFLRVFVVYLGLDVNLCVGTFELIYF